MGHFSSVKFSIDHKNLFSSLLRYLFFFAPRSIICETRFTLTWKMNFSLKVWLVGNITRRFT